MCTYYHCTYLSPLNEELSIFAKKDVYFLTEEDFLEFIKEKGPRVIVKDKIYV